MYLRFNSCNPFETNDNKSLPRLSLILKSVKRIQGLHVRTRLPITFDILEKICYKLRTGVFGNFVDILIECVCIVAFFGFLRCSEFSVLSSDKFYNASNLCTSDVSFYQSYAILRLKESKTDPFRKGVNIHLHKVKHSICPFSALEKYFSVRAKRSSQNFATEPLFITEFNQALERKYFLEKLKHVYVASIRHCTTDIPLDQALQLVLVKPI